jgi:fimbrial chaperone protein
MSRFRSRTRAASAVLALTCIAGLASASQFNVGITRILLGADHPVETEVLTNQEARDVSFEVHVTRWKQLADGTWDLQPTDALLVHPLIVRMPKDGQARIRVGTLSPSVATEEAYRVEFRELPDRTPAANGQVRMLTNVSVPVFVQPANAKADLSMTVAGIDTKTLDLAFRNDGTGFAPPAPAKLRILDANNRPLHDGDATTVYVLAGAQAPMHAQVPASVCARAASVELTIGNAKPLVAAIAPGVRRCVR